MEQERDQKSTGSIDVTRHKVGSLTVYEVTDYELEQFEKGAPSSIYLNFSIFLSSIAVSFLVALLSTNIESEKVFIVFLIITIIGFALGLLLMFIWLRNRSSMQSVVQKIKERKP